MIHILNIVLSFNVNNESVVIAVVSPVLFVRCLTLGALQSLKLFLTQTTIRKLLIKLPTSSNVKVIRIMTYDKQLKLSG